MLLCEWRRASASASVNASAGADVLFRVLVLVKMCTVLKRLEEPL